MCGSTEKVKKCFSPTVHVINPSKRALLWQDIRSSNVLKLLKARPSKPLQCMQTAHKYVI